MALRRVHLSHDRDYRAGVTRVWFHCLDRADLLVQRAVPVSTRRVAAERLAQPLETRVSRHRPIARSPAHHRSGGTREAFRALDSQDTSAPLVERPGHHDAMSSGERGGVHLAQISVSSQPADIAACADETVRQAQHMRSVCRRDAERLQVPADHDLRLRDARRPDRESDELAYIGSRPGNVRAVVEAGGLIHPQPSRTGSGQRPLDRGENTAPPLLPAERRSSGSRGSRGRCW